MFRIEEFNGNPSFLDANTVYGLTSEKQKVLRFVLPMYIF